MDLKQPRLKFLAPVKFQYEKKQINLKDLSKVDKPGLFKLFTKSNKRERERRSRKRRRKLPFKQRIGIMNILFREVETNLILPSPIIY